MGIHIDHLCAGYGQLPVLTDVGMAVESGEVLSILGPNAAGKTTVLRAVSGLIEPTAGSITVDGEDLLQIPPHLRPSRGVAHVPEGRGLFKGMTVEENLQVVQVPRDAPRPLRPVEDAYALFPALHAMRRRRAAGLSGGEQQMLSIARALRVNPTVLMLDEPSSGLAPLIVEQLFTVIKDICNTGISVILVEQQAHAALEIADRVVLLVGGRVALAEDRARLDTDEIERIYLGARAPSDAAATEAT